MKKIFTLLLAVLFSAQFASAQKTLYVNSKSGNLSAYTVNKVTFDLFTFTYGGATEVTEEMFSASFKVAFKSDAYKSLKQALKVGVCISDLNENPTTADSKIMEDSTLNEYTFSVYGLDAGTTYYYRAYVKVNDAVYYGDVKSVTTDGKKSTNYKIINGHKFVDLGLPSGLLWATCNVGATTSADDGNYYAWGETEPKSFYDWSTYKYYSSSDQTKYNDSDGKTTLDKEDDAAYVNWGASCRIPTNDEFTELCNTSNCTWTRTSKTTSDGSSIEGYTVASVKNGNSIFLPASGYRYDGTAEYPYPGSEGYYWSSTLRYTAAAYCLCSVAPRIRYFFPRCCGYPVRPVAEP